MSARPDEGHMIKQAKSGDKAAISQLYELHVDKIFRYVSYRVPESDVEDVTAEVFVRMVQGLGNYTYRGAPFEAWLYRIASGRIADYHRKNSRRPTEEIDEQLKDDQTLPEMRLLREQEQAGIRDALQKLTDDEQQLLILRFVERKSYQEVSEIMGKEEAALRTAQHRALKHLAHLMGAEGKSRHYLRGRKEPEQD
jgi:RNA polymerase sigma-70 factor (ECF subfamily)